MSNTIKSIVKSYALFEIFVLGLLSGMPFSILYTSISGAIDAGNRL
jgi:hypothetical protein